MFAHDLSPTRATRITSFTGPGTPCILQACAISISPRRAWLFRLLVLPLGKVTHASPSQLGLVNPYEAPYLPAGQGKHFFQIAIYVFTRFTNDLIRVIRTNGKNIANKNTIRSKPEKLSYLRTSGVLRGPRFRSKHKYGRSVVNVFWISNRRHDFISNTTLSVLKNRPDSLRYRSRSTEAGWLLNIFIILLLTILFVVLVWCDDGVFCYCFFALVDVAIFNWSNALLLSLVRLPLFEYLSQELSGG